MRITIGSKVVHKSSPDVGSVTELWQGKRAHVEWADGLAGWVPLQSLTAVRDVVRERARDYTPAVPAAVINTWAVQYDTTDEQIREWLNQS